MALPGALCNHVSRLGTWGGNVRVAGRAWEAPDCDGASLPCTSHSQVRTVLRHAQHSPPALHGPASPRLTLEAVAMAC
jgi:hypothetical protein